MLVIISDLHLDDHSLSVEPISSDMVQYFRYNISRILREKKIFEKPKPLELCLLGDCLDILRSSRWHDAGVNVRPWSAPSRTQEDMVNKILTSILQANRDVFVELKKLLGDYDSKVVYVLGNHDQLLGVYESAQRLICEALGINQGKTSFCMAYTWPEYCVYAFHGHKHDQRNYDIPVPSLGTISFVELLNRFPCELEKILEKKSFALKRVKQFASVELSSVSLWIDEMLNAVGDDRLLRQVFAKVVKRFFTLEVVKLWAQSRTFSTNWFSAWSFQLGIRVLTVMPAWAFRFLFKFAGFFVEGSPMDTVLIDKAHEELEKHTNKNIRYVVCGHTHIFRRVPLGVINGLENYYLNSGAWGRSLEFSKHGKGEKRFLPRDSLGYLVFYKSNENSKFAFEVWSGSLGPMESI